MNDPLDLYEQLQVVLRIVQKELQADNLDVTLRCGTRPPRTRRRCPLLMARFLASRKACSPVESMKVRSWRSRTIVEARRRD